MAAPVFTVDNLSDHAAAYAEVGVQRWPPVPQRHRRSTWVEYVDD